MSKGNSGPAIEFVSVSKAFLCFAVHHASSHLGCLASYAASPTPRPVCKMLGNGRPSGTGIGEKGDTDRGLLPLTDQQFRHRRKLRNGFKVLITVRVSLPICKNERDSVGSKGMAADEEEATPSRQPGVLPPPRAVSPAHTPSQPVDGTSAWSSAVRVAVVMHWLPPSGEHVGEGVHGLGGLDTHGAGVAFGEPGERRQDACLSSE